MTDPNSPFITTSNKLRVLIADDVETTRDSTRRLLSLESELEIVGIAQNGLEALRVMREQNVDIAFMDIKMPRMDGLQATQMMLKENPLMSCVILSAERDEESLRGAVAAGASGYLIKPYTSEELAETVERVVAQVRNRKKIWAEQGNTIASSSDQDKQLKRERDGYMQALCQEYVKNDRMDERAERLFETMASQPDCDRAYVEYLARIYAKRKQWGKLKQLASSLEKADMPTKSKAPSSSMRRNNR